MNPLRVSVHGLVDMEASLDKVFIGGYVFETLVAISEEEQANGLMFKKWPPPIMSFPYKTAGIRKFWMKNTISPLDIIFCRGGKVIEICKGDPMSTALVGPNQASDLVVELPQGTAAKLGVSVGDDVRLRRSKETIKKLFSSSFID